MEASAKVPFVVQCPEKIAKGQQIDRAINTTDFLPTMLGLIGVETAGKEEGRDLSPLLAGGEVRGEDITFMRSTGKPGDDKGWMAAVTPAHKLILSNQDDPWLLDLEKDPDELKNFINEADQAATLKRMAKALKQYAKAHGDSYAEHPHTGKMLAELAS